jgi:hypothetical protein
VVVAVEVVTAVLDPVTETVVEAPLDVIDGLLDPDAEALMLEVAAATAEEYAVGDSEMRAEVMYGFTLSGTSEYQSG